MDEPKDNPSQPPKTQKPDWMNEPWATRKAKQKEVPEEEKAFDWQEYRRVYKSDPEKFINGVENSQGRYHKLAISTLDSTSRLKSVTRASESRNPNIRDMQKTVEQMARKFGTFSIIPELIIHNDEIFSGGRTGALVGMPQFIETDKKSISRLLEHPEQIRYVIAHELAHIANGDVEAANKTARMTAPFNQKPEILADRLGAIIHGNPKKYAESGLAFFKGGKTELHGYNSKRLSLNGAARMMHKWADILENEGATDKKTGEIIDRKKAMKVYELSKKFTEGMVKWKNFAEGLGELNKPPAHKR